MHFTIHSQQNYFLECQQPYVGGLGEKPERLDIVIKGSQRTKIDRIILKEESYVIALGKSLRRAYLNVQ